MARLINDDPTMYAEQALEGFAKANARYVKPVYGGVVRSTRTPQGKVALVVGGGSGHYPAFAGWVGPGFADGAVAGNIFAGREPRTRFGLINRAAMRREAATLLAPLGVPYDADTPVEGVA